MKSLRAIFDRFRTVQPTESGRLPQQVRDYASRKDMGSLLAWLQGLPRSEVEAPEFRALIEEVRQSGWADKDIEKLGIFGHYYGGRFEEAYRQAERFSIKGMDFDPDLSVVAAYSLHHLCRFDEAYRLLGTLRACEEKFAGRSDYALAAALICRAANEPCEAKRYIDLARGLAPDDTIIACNAYATYFELGETEAFGVLQRDFRLGRYDLEKAGFAAAVVELAQDNYAEGFRLLEARYATDEAYRYLNRGLFDRPRWRGEPLAGKTLLVSAEQGLGDTIQMARYLLALGRLGARSVAMESQPEALPLLQYNFPDIQIVERKYGVAPELRFDFWVGMMSLPHLLGATADNVPGQAGYLRVPPENAHYWHRRLAELTHGARPRIGLSWSGQPTHRADRRRSIPVSRMMDAIRDIDADFVALQTHLREVHPPNLIDVSEELLTLGDTAALIDEMDLVITVDTSAVHVAGAIGKEAWLLLPYRYEWRWGLEGERNRWYDSVKVLRQPMHGDWDSVLEEVFGLRLREFMRLQWRK